MVDRRVTHGDFRVGAAFTQQVKDLMRAMPNWGNLTPEMRESLDMCIHKIHRILSGQHDLEEHWDDIGGYALLISKILRGEY